MIILNKDKIKNKIYKRCSDDLQAGRIGGAAVLVKQNGKTLYREFFGSAGEEREINEKTLFRLASMTKPITATAILKEIEKGRLIPHHQLFSAYGDSFKQRIPLSREDAMRYLHGEELAQSEGAGYAAVFYGPLALGGAKIANARLKNHYPKGLRNP